MDDGIYSSSKENREPCVGFGGDLGVGFFVGGFLGVARGVAVDSCLVSMTSEGGSLASWVFGAVFGGRISASFWVIPEKRWVVRWAPVSRSVGSPTMVTETLARLTAV